MFKPVRVSTISFEQALTMTLAMAEIQTQVSPRSEWGRRLRYLLLGPKTFCFSKTIDSL